MDFRPESLIHSGCSEYLFLLEAHSRLFLMLDSCNSSYNFGSKSRPRVIKVAVPKSLMLQEEQRRVTNRELCRDELLGLLREAASLGQSLGKHHMLAPAASESSAMLVSKVILFKFAKSTVLIAVAQLCLKLRKTSPCC